MQSTSQVIENTGSRESVKYQFTHFDRKHAPELMSWFKSAHDVIFWSGKKFKYPYNQQTFISQLRLDHIAGYTLLNEDFSEVLGFGQLMYDNGRCHLVRLAVNPNLRKQGHGKVLVKSLCYQGYKRFRVETFSLFVNKNNQAAFNLYRKLGFQVSEYEGAIPEQSWYMKRALTP